MLKSSGGLMPCSSEREFRSSGGLAPCHSDDDDDIFDDLEEILGQLKAIDRKFMNRLKDPARYELLYEKINNSDNTIIKGVLDSHLHARFTRIDLLAERLFDGARYTFEEDDEMSTYSILPLQNEADLAILHIPKEEYIKSVQEDTRFPAKEQYGANLDILLANNSLFKDHQFALRIPVFKEDNTIPDEKKGRYGHIVLVNYTKEGETFQYLNSASTLGILEKNVLKAMRKYAN